MNTVTKQLFGQFAILLFCCVSLLSSQQHVQNNYAGTDTPHRRFEYKFSFKGPYLAQKDGTVPFWEYSGATIASEEMIRITPSLRSKKGQVWSRQRTTFEWWEVEIMFRVNGKGRIGADGLAFWFTDQKYPEGPVFGSADHWRGLALFFDSFDNDNKGNNPYIMAMVNDGTKSYDHNSDGINQQLQGCLRDFRNKPFPVRTRIEYYKNILTVMFHSGNTNNENDYELCLRVENVFLPQYGHFGLSAATGGLADDHDALRFLTYSLIPQSQLQASVGLSDADKQRFSQEYEQYKEKLEKQREEYLKAHPDEARKLEMESEKAIESEYDYSVRELQQIFQGQSEVYENVKAMNRKLDEIIGRQERALSLISSIQSGGGGPAHIAPGAVQSGAPISRPEVESILSVQREVLQNSREIKVLVQHVPNQVGQQQVQQQQQHPNGGSQDASNQQLALLQQLLSEVRENINVVKREFGSLTTRIASGGGGGAVPGGPAALGACPQSSCTSTATLIFLLTTQAIVLVGTLYFLYNRAANQSKKFY